MNIEIYFDKILLVNYILIKRIKILICTHIGNIEKFK